MRGTQQEDPQREGQHNLVTIKPVMPDRDRDWQKVSRANAAQALAQRNDKRHVVSHIDEHTKLQSSSVASTIPICSLMFDNTCIGRVPLK